MIKSAVTINLIGSMSAGPWIFWHDLEESLKKAAGLGFDGVELFTGSGADVDAGYLRQQLDHYGLELAAVGTGAGKVIHGGLTLTDPDPNIRQKAISFISEMISFGAQFGAPAIIGSMQGNVLPGGNREQTMDWLVQGLEVLQKTASDQGVMLIYEPLNRYETNLLNTLKAGTEFLKTERLEKHQIAGRSFPHEYRGRQPATNHYGIRKLYWPCTLRGLQP